MWSLYRRVIGLLAALAQAGLGKFSRETECDDEKSRKFHRRTFQDRQAASKGTVKMNKDGERLGIWNRYDDDAKWRSEIRKSMWLKECFELRKGL